MLFRSALLDLVESSRSEGSVEACELESFDEPAFAKTHQLASSGAARSETVSAPINLLLRQLVLRRRGSLALPDSLDCHRRPCRENFELNDEVEHHMLRPQVSSALLNDSGCEDLTLSSESTKTFE